jgi:GNAT superfamily N-acetyltransferase
MIPALKALWVEAFEDSKAYADFFFKHRFEDISTFVYLNNNIPVSMAFVFDEELYHNGTYVDAGYIYGVATAKTHQGKGYSTEVLKHIQSLYPTTFLKPVSERLFDFYSRKGYKTAFAITEKTLLTSGNCLMDQLHEPISYTFDNISPKEYKIIRDHHFQSEGYIRWSDASIAYAIAENKFCGGSALKVTSPLNSNEEIILSRCYNNQLHVKETTLSGQSLYDVVFLLMKENNVNKCHIRLPWDDSTAPHAFGMLHSSFPIENGYCNLVLD